MDQRRRSGPRRRADATLATVLGYVGAEVLGCSGARVPVARDALGDDGRVAGAPTRERLAEAVATIVAEVRAAGQQ